MLQLSIDDPTAFVKICHALSTPLRVNIIRRLDNRVLSCLELSKELGYPLSTISSNVKILEEAGLLSCCRPRTARKSSAPSYTATL